ncbi:cytochrome P450 [Marasmius fiardii PR-910]|nr:cytochrome P450 [Marasmius fiardii PR-910]
MVYSPDLKTSLVLLLCALLALCVSKIRKIGTREPYLPPGPPTTWLLGNVSAFPTVWPWFKFTRWAEEYGDIYSLKIGSSTVIVITGAEVVRELMDKRSAATAGRPKSWMIDTVTDGLHIALGRYSDGWQILRKTVQVIFSPKAVQSQLPIQRAEATQLLYDFLKTPEGFCEHLRRYTNSVIMSIVYGKRCPRYESYETKAFYESQRIWNIALDPGAHPPLDVFPILNYIPEKWAPWKRIAREVRRQQRDLYFTVLDECEKRIMKGVENGCYMEEVLARQEEFQLTREMIGYLGGVLLEGGSETTATILHTLCLFLTAYPSVQQKAQKEIDAAVGHERLPSLEDFSNLPYIQAVMKEVHRLRPAAPILIPHSSLTTEEYRGYVIPEGTTIFVNMWGIFHSPEYFEDPEVFSPDRFLLNEQGTKPGVDITNFRSNLVFGCGRRICPGMNLANNSLMLNTMNLIWAFNFTPLRNPEGKDLPVNVNDFERGLVYVPKPFPCQITPRNDHVVEIIEREFRDSTETFLKFERDLSMEDRKWVEETRRNI